MKKLILLSLTATFIFSSVSAFACGDGEANGSRELFKFSQVQILHLVMIHHLLEDN